MPVDYAEVLREMDAQITTLENELDTLRTTRPGIVLLRNKQNPALSSSPVFTPRGRYSGLGNQAAVRLLMADGQLRSRDEIYEQLRDGGFTSDAANPVGSIGATLSQMKEELERVEDRWRKRSSPTSAELAEYGSPVTFSAPAQSSLAATVLQVRPVTTAWQTPS